jgi:hypothetical protein
MDMTVILVTAGAGIIIGILIGLMINSLRGDASKRAVQSERTERGIDNILLWHDQEGGNLIVDLDGSTFLRVNEMRTDQRARLETVYSQLKRFMGVQDTAPRLTPITPVETQIERPTQVPSVKPVTPPAQPQIATSQPSPLQTASGQPNPLRPTIAQPAPFQPAFTHSIPEQPSIPVPPLASAPILELNVVQPVAVGKKGAKKPLPEPVKPLNIVSEIDEILQDMIIGTPMLDRGLELVETPAHTIAVWIDSHQFESIDAVTDPEVQQIIRAAVNKWENKPR